MKIFNSLDHLPLSTPTSLALGTFDGVHLGHQKVLNAMLENIHEHQLKSAVFTFSDVPKQFGSKPSLLMSANEKISIFESMGIDYCVIVPFDQKVKDIDRELFANYLRERLAIKKLTVGSDFRFGKGAKGDVAFLETYCSKYAIELNSLQIISSNDNKISSSKIRDALQQGDIELANEMLGRYHFLTGNVKVGKKLGHTIGYATANLAIKSHMTTVKSGIYVTKTTIGDKTYQSVSNVGYNPTFDQDDFNIETYILDFNQNIYGQKITVHFVKRIRDELKFDSVKALTDKIAEDVEYTKTFFENC